MPAESYLEMGNRAFFTENGVVDLSASPDALIATHADFCRPFHASGSMVEAVRIQLQRRAVALGWTLDGSDPYAGLHLVADGVRIEPVTRGLAVRFVVPAATRNLWIVSETSRPCEISDSGDGRDLGACIGGIAIDDGFAPSRRIELANPMLCVGFHDLEEGVRRWTTARARLPAILWEDVADDFFLRLDLAGPALPRWVAPVSYASHAPDESRLALMTVA